MASTLPPLIRDNPTATLAPEIGGTVTVGAISLSGLTVLSADQFSDILTDFVGRSLGSNDLAALTDRIATRARDRGYVFATARIMPQRLTAGVLIVAVDEGRIDRVDVDGSDNRAVRAALAPLANGQPVTLGALERRLLIAGDIDGIRVRRAKLVRDGSVGALVVTVAQDRVSASLSLRNDGTRPIGPIELHASLMIAQLFAADDSVTFGYSTSLVQPRELQYGRVRYQKQIGTTGTALSIASTYSVIQPGSYLSSYDILGRSWSQSLGLLQPLYRRRHSSLWLTGSLEVDNLTQRRGSTEVRRDRASVARVGLYGYDDMLGGRLRVSAILSQGVDLFDATGRNDPLASRFDADGTFTAANVWIEWTRPMGSGFSIRLAGDSQIASQPLLVGEEVSLGGSTFLRGYDWSERSGDQGAMGSAELRWDIKRPFGIARRAQLYAFGDGGVARNLSNGFGGGSLASVGGGLRVDITRSFGATAEIAVPLSGVRYDTRNRQPRVNLGISTSF
ncbi:ShlB/FhaC/HecB family hemolysin secretion/activation protein [Sphingomonas panacisoli]|uniref:ShlB/FhaC/HecB family hemolysin secretion/activation protein n=1 Tax=Sphingomonas panacisoli TaxID=1813879 RepID=UPI0016493589|nr:ShlB/FhaC/HecB family hemolysin secretion/activation protein [Sphingomonas panacisoli]